MLCIQHHTVLPHNGDKCLVHLLSTSAESQYDSAAWAASAALFLSYDEVLFWDTLSSVGHVKLGAKWNVSKVIQNQPLFILPLTVKTISSTHKGSDKVANSLISPFCQDNIKSASVQHIIQTLLLTSSTGFTEWSTSRLSKPLADTLAHCTLIFPLWFCHCVSNINVLGHQG